MLFKNPVRTSKRTPHFTITNINWLTLFKFNFIPFVSCTANDCKENPFPLTLIYNQWPHPCCGHLEALAQLDKKFLIFHGSPRFVFVLISARHWSLSCARWTLSTSSHLFCQGPIKNPFNF